MNNPLPNSPASRASAVADHVAWRQHIPALAAAAAGIKRASDDWDAVSDSFCDKDGWPLDEKGYADGKVKRDATAWEHVEVFLAHGPEVLAGVRAAATGADYVEGPVSKDLRQVHGVGTALERAGQIRHQWEQVIALMDASLPGSRELYRERAKEERNSEGWHTTPTNWPSRARRSSGPPSTWLPGRTPNSLRRLNALGWLSPGPPPVPPGCCPLRLLRSHRPRRRPRVVPADALSTWSR